MQWARPSSKVLQVHMQTTFPDRYEAAQSIFGYSGGAFGDTLGKKCWHDAACIMHDFELDWCIGVGCRYPSDCDLPIVLPDFPYEVSGPRSSSFDAVVLLVLPRLADVVLFQPQWSPCSRITCIKVGTCSVWFGIYMPPRLRGQNEHVRLSLIKLLFRTVDEASRAKANFGASIYVCGDLNPSGDIEHVYGQLLVQHNMRDHLPQDAPTHSAGHKLDIVLSRQPPRL